jgi:hypothetical protein
MMLSHKEYGRCSKEQAIKALGALPPKAKKSVPGLALVTIIDQLEANGSAPLEPILAELFPDDPVEKARRRLTTEIANRVYKDDAGNAPLRIATTRKGIEPALIWLETPIATDTRGLTDVGERYAPEHFIPAEAIQRTSEEIKQEIANPPKSSAQAATGSSPEQLVETANEDGRATVPLRESPSKSEAHRIAELKALENATRPNAGANDSSRGVDTTHFMSTDARQTSGFSAFADAVHQVGQTVNALNAMLAWASDGAKIAPKLLALLGDYGTGKTSHALQFSRILNGEVAHEKRPSPSLSALHIDLAYLRGAPGLAQLNVTQLIDLVIKVRGLSEVLSANEVVHEVRSGTRIVVYDGLDELMQTDHAQLHSVFRQLLQIFEPDPVSREPSRARAIVSCRTHYFRDLAEQHEFFNSRMRGSVSSKDYLCLYLLPWDMNTVRGYLGKRLSEAEANALAETIRTTYNLEELASRPVLLAMMCEQVGEVLRMREQNGGSITASTLYAQTVAMWVRRDDEKHILQPTHKPILMGALACAMWNSGKEQWEAERLDAWLRKTVDLLFPNHYAPDQTRAIQDDLRTATFIVRPNGEGFTFAHRSFFEFFLARHLITLLDWSDLPDMTLRGERSLLPERDFNIESLSFIKELLYAGSERREARSTRLWSWLSYEGGSQRDARLDDFALPAPKCHAVLFRIACSLGLSAPIDANSTNLRFLSLHGIVAYKMEFPPLDVRRADLTLARFVRCRMPAVKAAYASLESALFKDCRLTNFDSLNASTAGLLLRQTPPAKLLDCSVEKPMIGPWTRPTRETHLSVVRSRSFGAQLVHADNEIAIVVCFGRFAYCWNMTTGTVSWHAKSRNAFSLYDGVWIVDRESGFLIHIENPKGELEKFALCDGSYEISVNGRLGAKYNPRPLHLRKESRGDTLGVFQYCIQSGALSGCTRYFVHGESAPASTACFDAEGRLVDYDEEAADTWLRYLGNGYPQPVEAAWLELDEFGRVLGPKKGVST